MEYVQERVATLHAFGDGSPDAPTDRAAVVVPMTEREYAGLAAERVLSELEALDPARVVVPLRAPADRVGAFREWLDGFELPLETVWCDGPRVADLLADAGLDGERGKGRDVWLALGRALEEEYVVVHDADTKSYSREYVRRLLFPLANGFDFSKGYYARVENGQLYGRLFRLFYAPLVRALRDGHPESEFLEYMAAFRYALAGEFAAASDVVASFPVQRTWGLEVGTLAAAYDAVGVDGAAQVDLGSYEHDHRAVSGPTGLSDMSRSVGAALLRAAGEHGVDPEYESLPDTYRAVAESYVDRYAVDAEFNGLSYDRSGEREQVDTYAASIAPPGADTRLPPWSEADLSPAAVADAARADARDAANGEVAGDE
ncbi:glycosyltransferase family protein [Halobaculum gomorrense]|uniref:Glucosyl-3-phosphoglycerate synthase n=1 Tax=Halobaculum gomorrense TaxID=43928 RepID=A0A1M5KX29_9EURY|nr:glycosyl transferase family 2 [Halobaculum gomorrense]SHG56713.1 glucosyl-3-phosphoglycerate synthase [Halobaculum gomorrense]